jgi:hypothetical protein
MEAKIFDRLLMEGLYFVARGDEANAFYAMTRSWPISISIFFASKELPLV